MPARIRAVGALSSISKMSVRVAGVLRPARALKMMVSGDLKTIVSFVQPLTAEASPNIANGFGASFKPEVVQTSYVTAVPTGGLAPYQYAWAIFSGDSINIGNSANATTNFSSPLYGSTTSSVARCTITDALGSTATCDVSIFLQHEIT